MSTLWHGRFEGGPAEELLAFTVSLPVRPAPRGRRHRRLARPRAGPASGPASSTATRPTRCSPRSTRSSSELADGHVRVRARPTRTSTPRSSAGSPSSPAPPGAKLHTGRSRNDQVATDLRLYTKRELARRRRAGCWRCRRCCSTGPIEAGDAYLPGYTHLQRAQPVLLAHHLLAHGWALARDVDRLLDTRRRARRVAARRRRAGRLVAAARPRRRRRRPRLRRRVRQLARRGERPRLRGRGPVRPRAARRPPVAARRGGRAVVHRRVRLPAASPTPTPPVSSMLPQKKNPDIAELARGKAGRLIGNLTGLLATLKGLPLAYNRDLQEDKEPLFDARRPGLLGPRRHDRPAGHVDVRHRGACRRPPTRPTRAATDLAEYLVERGMPFREAHAVVGALVRRSLDDGVPLAELVAAARRSSARTRRAPARPRRLGHAPHHPRRRRSRRRSAAQLERFRARLAADRGAGRRRLTPTSTAGPTDTRSRSATARSTCSRWCSTPTTWPTSTTPCPTGSSRALGWTGVDGSTSWWSRPRSTGRARPPTATAAGAVRDQPLGAHVVRDPGRGDRRGRAGVHRRHRQRLRRPRHQGHAGRARPPARLARAGAGRRRRVTDVMDRT